MRSNDTKCFLMLSASLLGLWIFADLK